MRRRFIVLPTAAVVLILLVLAALALLSARRSLQSGVVEMRAAEADLQSFHRDRTAGTLVDAVSGRVHRAYSDFHSADDRLAPLALIVRHLGWVPGVGDSLSVAPDVARTADLTARGTLRLLDGLRPLVGAMTANPHGGRSRMEVLVGRLSQRHADFVGGARDLHDAQAVRHAIPGGHHEPAVASALRSLDRQLPRLMVFARTLTVLPGVLGESRPRTYLIAYQNSDELRATGGFIGSAGLLTLDRGHAKQQFQGTGFRDNLSVPAPEPIQVYNGERGWLFRDSNWSPDFPTSAALERFFLGLDLHRQVDGVIDLTPQAAADILGATGPIYVAEYRRWVSAGNVAHLADQYAHWSVNPGPKTFASGDTRRKQFIGIVAGHLLGRINALSTQQWLTLFQSIASGMQHHDILVNFGDRAAQSLLRASGADGSVGHDTSDFLSVVDTNLSYNKINPFVHIKVGYRVLIQPDRWLQARLTLRYTNVRTHLRSEGFGPGGGALGKPDDYADFVRIYVPAGAQLIDQAGWTQPWYPGPAYGKTMFCGYLIVPAGRTRTLRLTYVVPPNVFAWSHGSTYRLVVPHQAGSHPDSVHVAVRHDGRTRNWNAAAPTTDWTEQMPIQQRPFQPIPMPRQASDTVAPGHWIEPHAFLGKPNPRGPYIGAP